MKTIQALILAGLVALGLPGANAAPGLVSSGPALAVSAVPAASAVLQWSLGLVVDGRDAGETGVRVVALSPEGAAERMGVRVGDRLLAVNGESLVGVQAPSALFERALAAGDGEVRLEVERDGTPLTLAGRAGDAMPAGVAAQASCGYVSTVGVQPRMSRNIFQAEITQINGQSTPLRPLNRYQVPAGRNVVVVREFIDRHLLPNADIQRIHRVQRREGKRAYKVLVVDVEPGTRYSIGAEWLPERMSPDEIRDHDWWQPVVWESRAEDCR